MSSPAITGTPAPTSYLANSDTSDAKPHGSMTVSGRELEVREIDDRLDEIADCFDECLDDCIDSIEDCCDRLGFFIEDIGSALETVDQAIRTFFFDRYVDCHLFQRAISSMGNGATSADIQRSIEVLTQLRTQLQDTGYVQAILSFDTLDLRAEALILKPADFNFDLERYIYNDPINQTLRQELIRECDRAIFFQRTLSVVNIFYNTFGLNTHSSSPATTVDTSADGPVIFWINQSIIPRAYWLDLLFKKDGPTAYEGTVKYNSFRIPRIIIEKGREIKTLINQFEQLQELVDNLGSEGAEESEDKFFDVPELYKDYMNEIMLIPVFDASHPDIQDQLATPAGAIAIASDARLKRHAMDYRNFEHQFRSESWSLDDVRCAICRHAIKRENMLIDTVLQDDILNFLKGKLGSQATTAAVQP